MPLKGTLSAANDHIDDINLMSSDPGRLDQALLQIDSGAGAGGGVAHVRIDVKVDAAANYIAGDTYPLGASTGLVVRMPKYPYVRLTLIDTTDATMVNTVYAR